MLLLTLAIGAGLFCLGILVATKALAGKPGVQPSPRGSMILAGMSGVSGVILYFGLKNYGQDILKAQSTAGRIFWAATSFVMLFSLLLQLWQRRDAGNVLLDLGQPNKYLQFTMAGVVALAAIIPLFTAPAGLTWQTLFYLTMSVWFLCQAFTGLQVRVRGIATGGGLLKWEKVKSFEWKKRDTVSFTTTSVMPWSRKFDLQVPLEHVESLQRIFTQYMRKGSET